MDESSTPALVWPGNADWLVPVLYVYIPLEEALQCGRTDFYINLHLK